MPTNIKKTALLRKILMLEFSVLDSPYAIVASDFEGTIENLKDLEEISLLVNFTSQHSHNDSFLNKLEQYVAANRAKLNKLGITDENIDEKFHKKTVKPIGSLFEQLFDIAIESTEKKHLQNLLWFIEEGASSPSEKQALHDAIIKSANKFLDALNSSGSASTFRRGVKILQNCPGGQEQLNIYYENYDNVCSLLKNKEIYFSDLENARILRKIGNTLRTRLPGELLDIVTPGNAQTIAAVIHHGISNSDFIIDFKAKLKEEVTIQFLLGKGVSMQAIQYLATGKYDHREHNETVRSLVATVTSTTPQPAASVTSKTISEVVSSVTLKSTDQRNTPVFKTERKEMHEGNQVKQVSLGVITDDQGVAIKIPGLNATEFANLARQRADTLTEPLLRNKQPDFGFGTSNSPRVIDIQLSDCQSPDAQLDLGAVILAKTKLEATGQYQVRMSAELEAASQKFLTSNRHATAILQEREKIAPSLTQNQNNTGFQLRRE